MIRPDSGCTLAITAITGCKQNASGSDLACLLGSLCHDHVSVAGSDEKVHVVLGCPITKVFCLTLLSHY